MSWRIPEMSPLYGALTAALFVASFGFWGEQFVEYPRTPPDLLSDDGWLSEPVPPTEPLPEVARRPATPLLAEEWGPNPFLNQSEREIYGGPLAYLTTTGTQESYVSGMPELRAVILSDENRIVILDGEALEAGQAIGNYRVEQVEGRRVLLRGQDGLRWLELASREGIDIKEAN